MTHSIRQRWRAFSPWQRTLASALGAMLVGWSAVLLSPALRRGASHGPSLEVAAPAEPAAPSAVQVTPSAAQATPTPPRSAASAPVPATPGVDARASALAALRTGLASDNAGTRIEALRAARDQHLTEALPELLQRDLAQDPDSAPTLIQVSAQLAQEAQPLQRTAALTQLDTWLKQEVARAGDAARGNVSVLVATLAKWQGREAAPALVEVLQDQRVPLHVQTVAVDGIERLRAGSARAELATFRARIAQSPPRGGFELELHQEALQAAERALAKLPPE